jgi:hypothetical protein
MLTHQSDAGDVELVTDWKMAIEDLKGLIEKTNNLTKNSGGAWRFASTIVASKIDVTLLPLRRTGGFRLAMIPSSLQSALFLQCAHSLAAGKAIRTCHACGTWFEAGGSGNRRADAKFCSDKCRFDFNNKPKREHK